VLLLGFLPFTVAVAVGLWTSTRDAGSEAVRRFRGRGTAGARTPSPVLYAGAMLWPPLVLLCIAQSKLATYLLPLLPAVAFVASGHVVAAHARLSRTMRWSAPVIVGVLGAVTAAIPFVLRGGSDLAAALPGHGTTLAVAVTALLAAAAVGAVMVVRRRPAAGWIVAAGGMTAALLAVLPVSDAMTEDSDARVLVATLRRLRDPGSRVVVAGACAQDYTVVHGLRERVAIWGRARELGMGHFAEVTKPDVPIPDDPYVVSGANLTNAWLIDDGRLADLWRGPEPVWLIGRPIDVTALRRAKLEVFEVAANSERTLVSNRAVPTPP
jgi:hypothetical protein